LLLGVRDGRVISGVGLSHGRLVRGPRLRHLPGLRLCGLLQRRAVLGLDLGDGVGVVCLELSYGLAVLAFCLRTGGLRLVELCVGLGQCFLGAR